MVEREKEGRRDAETEGMGRGSETRESGGRMRAGAGIFGVRGGRSFAGIRGRENGFLGESDDDNRPRGTEGDH